MRFIWALFILVSLFIPVAFLIIGVWVFPKIFIDRVFVVLLFL